MKQIFNKKELLGKTIKFIGVYSLRQYIIFNDNTYCVINIDYLSKGLLLDEIFDITPSIKNYQILYAIGLIDKKSYNQFKKEAIKAYEEYLVRVDIKKLKELKLKYPNE